jgi:phage-related protein
VKAALFHPKARAVLRTFPQEVRRKFGQLIFDLQKGEKLTMPMSRPVPAIAAGVEELE